MPGSSHVRMRLKDITYSIVIPAYNEGARLRPTMENVLVFLEQQGWNAEVIVVNDGSSDNTATLVQEFAEENPAVRLIENPANCGKGYSVRNGMLHARGDVLLFTDADLSSPIQEMTKLLEALAGGGGYCDRFTLVVCRIADAAAIPASSALWKDLQPLAADCLGFAV